MSCSAAVFPRKYPKCGSSKSVASVSDWIQFRRRYGENYHQYEKESDSKIRPVLLGTRPWPYKGRTMLLVKELKQLFYHSMIFAPP